MDPDELVQLPVEYGIVLTPIITVADYFGPQLRDTIKRSISVGNQSDRRFTFSIPVYR